MKRLSFDKRFVNKTNDDLISGKIHTIRQNYSFWKQFEGQEVALFTWEGKPYRRGSKQKIFCVKRIVNVQETWLRIDDLPNGMRALWFFVKTLDDPIDMEILSKNDGFRPPDRAADWFANYPLGKMAILHFSDFRY